MTRSVTSPRIAAISLFAFFAMAWLPLGQQSFMVDHWMKIGAFLAPTLIFFGFKTRSDNTSYWAMDVSLMACLLTASYLVHQVEEHWVDLLGRPYPLYEFLNGLIASFFGEDKYGILTREGIFYINAGMVWTAGFLAILTSPHQVFPSLAMAGIMFVNGIAHILNAVIAFEYNSGLATGLVLFLPLSITIFRALHASGTVSLRLIAAGILWGFIGHLLLFGGLFASHVFGVVPVPIYYIVLIGWGVVPSFVFRSNGSGRV
ncbi:MAG: HXXEE domain-containing protein [Pseudomonadota bacterium]